MIEIKARPSLGLGGCAILIKSLICKDMCSSSLILVDAGLCYTQTGHVDLTPPLVSVSN